MQVERLCCLAQHNYKEQPIARFTPVGQWIIFQARLHNTMQVDAVRVQKP